MDYKSPNFGFHGFFGGVPVSPFVTPKEVVAELAAHNIFVCDDTVRNWCTTGIHNKKCPELRYKLGAIRIGGRIHILRESLKTLIPLLDHLASS